MLELWHRSGQRVICTTEYVNLSGRIHVLDAFMKDSVDKKKMRQTVRKRIERRAKELKIRMDALKRVSDETESVRRKLH